MSFFVLGELLNQVLQAEDNGSALFLLRAAEELFRVLEEPIRTQIRLRNIFEMTFDGMERATQREQFEKLCCVYPDVGKLCDPARLPEVEPGQRTFRVNSIFGLRLLELALSGPAINYGIGCMPVSCVGRMRRQPNVII